MRGIHENLWSGTNMAKDTRVIGIYPQVKRETIGFSIIENYRVIFERKKS